MGGALLGIMLGHQISTIKVQVVLPKQVQPKEKESEGDVNHAQSVHTNTVLRRALSRHHEKHLCGRTQVTAQILTKNIYVMCFC